MVTQASSSFSLYESGSPALSCFSLRKGSNTKRKWCGNASGSLCLLGTWYLKQIQPCDALTFLLCSMLYVLNKNYYYSLNDSLQ